MAEWSLTHCIGLYQVIGIFLFLHNRRQGKRCIPDASPVSKRLSWLRSKKNNESARIPYERSDSTLVSQRPVRSSMSHIVYAFPRLYKAVVFKVKKVSLACFSSSSTLLPLPPPRTSTMSHPAPPPTATTAPSYSGQRVFGTAEPISGSASAFRTARFGVGPFGLPKVSTRLHHPFLFLTLF